MVATRSNNRRQARIPLDLEPDLVEYIETLSKLTKLPRTTLLRMLVKYGLHSLSEVIAHGDPKNWKPAEIYSIKK